jgi:hypothetical protein
MNQKARLWLHNLGAAVITGGSTTALAALGIVGANSVGVSVQSLDLKQVGFLFASGAIVGLLSYLKQSPLPPEE